MFAGLGAARIRRLWEDVGCQRLDAGLAVIVFEAAVDYGVDKAKAWLERAQQSSDPMEVIGNYIEEEARTWR